MRVTQAVVMGRAPALHGNTHITVPLAAPQQDTYLSSSNDTCSFTFVKTEEFQMWDATTHIPLLIRYLLGKNSIRNDPPTSFVIQKPLLRNRM